MLEFEWDEANEAHIARHGIAAKQAEAAVTIAPREYAVSLAGDELRIAYVGPDGDGRLLFVIVTPRAGKLRVVTAYPARREMRRFYREGRQPNEES
ncbi:MAG TPA: BrnT family toxin [Terriglobales bacterium]|nr:BrnT family toxin [Terriglobales bacterium]